MCHYIHRRDETANCLLNSSIEHKNMQISGHKQPSCFVNFIVNMNVQICKLLYITYFNLLYRNVR
jgi:hypothetical protein